jgi:hypothetical protein
MSGVLSTGTSAWAGMSPCLVQERQALPARDRRAIFRGDAFHFGPMSRFLVARVAQDHTVFIERV